MEFFRLLWGLFDRFGPKWLVIPGLVIVACALYGFSTLTLETSTGFIVALHIALMVGISMIMMPAQTNGLNQLPPELYAWNSDYEHLTTSCWCYWNSCWNFNSFLRFKKLPSDSI